MAERTHERSPWRIAHDRLASILEGSVSRSNGRDGGGATISLTRNAKGVTQIEVTVREDDALDARATAQTLYDSLRVDYPLPHGEGGTEVPRKGGNLPAEGVGPQPGEDIPF